MADGFLESHYEDYEQRKKAWLSKKGKKKHCAALRRRTIERPEDESL